MMDSDEVIAAVGSFADVSEIFIEITSALRAISGAQFVDRRCSMRREMRVGENQFQIGRGPGFRVDWYAEAEMANQYAIAFVEEVSWHDGVWTVEALVRMSHREDEELMLELPIQRVVSASDLGVQLIGHANALYEGRDDLISRFIQKGTASPENNV